MAKERFRMFYPNYLSVDFFTKGWSFFFNEEIYILFQLFFLGENYLFFLIVDIFILSMCMKSVAVAIFF